MIFRPSIVYTPGDPWLTLLERFSYLPVLPVSGSGKAHYQPIWAEDVADCVLSALRSSGPRRRAFELAGPETLTYDEIVRASLDPLGRRRPLLHVPLPLVRASLRALEPLAGSEGLRHLGGGRADGGADDDRRGTADAEALGVRPLPLASVLGAAA